MGKSKRTSVWTHISLFLSEIATEKDIPMSVVADEAMYAGLKKMGRMD